MTNFFRSPEKGYQASPKYWKTYFDYGLFETPEFNAKEKYCVVRLSEYQTHPLACIFLAGCFVVFGQMVSLGKNVGIKEVKCPYKNDLYHEWIVSWE